MSIIKLYFVSQISDLKYRWEIALPRKFFLTWDCYVNKYSEV